MKARINLQNLAQIGLIALALLLVDLAFFELIDRMLR